MSINVLDNNTAKLLTTAQVITSVTTAVKELVENSIDADASSIEIKLVDNGASLIEVNDNGRGIAASDTPFMALQSYTSKIKDFNDLDSLESYGFRGEALNSLCRVADVTVVTRTTEDEAARAYRVDRNGCIQSRELCHHSVGTTVRAKSLFKDLPVRRQIMTSSKRTNQDVKSLARAYAICRPKIRMNLRINGDIVLAKPSTETPRETLSRLFGNKFVERMDFIEKQINETSIELTLPRRDATELNDICQVGRYIFVNQRPVFYKEIEKTINKRLHDHFGEAIPSKKKLAFILGLVVPSSELDVNLEPNKTSVFLINQTKIIDALDELLMSFYGIVDESRNRMDSTEETILKNRSSTILEDVGGTSVGIDHSEESNDPRSCKKPRLEIESDESPRKNESVGKTCKSNKENRWSNLFTPNKINDVETISQLPVVDLGEDFTVDEISNLPKLDPAEVTTILGNAANENSNTTSNDSVNRRSTVTLEAWSKGQIATNLRGGTDVEIYGNIGERLQPRAKEPPEPDPSSSGCKGFRKFSKEIRPPIIEENPGINMVEMAKALMSRWRALSSEERGYYRDAASADAARLSKYDTSVASKKCQKTPRLTSETMEKNRKRLVDMLENMKNPKDRTKKDNIVKRTVVPLEMDVKSLTQTFFNRASKPRTRNIVLGAIDENLWIARTGSQIWALDLGQLYQGFALEKPNSIEKSRESVEDLVKRWLREQDGMSLLHPVFDLR